MTAVIQVYLWFMYYYEHIEHRRWGWLSINSIAFIRGNTRKRMEGPRAAWKIVVQGQFEYYGEQTILLHRHEEIQQLPVKHQGGAHSIRRSELFLTLYCESVPLTPP